MLIKKQTKQTNKQTLNSHQHIKKKKKKVGVSPFELYNTVTVTSTVVDLPPALLILSPTITTTAQ